jgi:hypothetical protein
MDAMASADDAPDGDMVDGGEEGGGDADAKINDLVDEEEHDGAGGAGTRVDDDVVVVVVAKSKRRNILDGMDGMERGILPPKRNRATTTATTAATTSMMMEHHVDGGTIAVVPPSSSSTASDVENYQVDDDEDDDDDDGGGGRGGDGTHCRASPNEISFDVSTDDDIKPSSESYRPVALFDTDHPRDRSMHDDVANISAYNYDSAEDGEMQQVSLGSYRSGADDGGGSIFAGVCDAILPVYTSEFPVDGGGTRCDEIGGVLDKEDDYGYNYDYNYDDDDDDNDEDVSSDKWQRRLHRRDIFIDDDDDDEPPLEEPLEGLAIAPNSIQFDEPDEFRTKDRPSPPLMASPTSIVQPPPPPPTTMRMSMPSPSYLFGDEYDDDMTIGHINTAPYVAAKNRYGEDRIAMDVDTDDNMPDTGRNESRFVAVHDSDSEDEITDPADILTQLSDAVLFGQTPKVLSQFMSDLMGSAKSVLSRPAVSVQQQGWGSGGVVRGGGGMEGSSAYNNEVDQIDDTGPIKIGDKLYSHSEAIKRWRQAKTKLSDRYSEFDNDGNVKVERTSFFDRSSLFLGNDEKVESRNSAKNDAGGGVAISLDELVIRFTDAEAEEIIVAENSVSEKGVDDDSEMNTSSDLHLSTIVHREIHRSTLRSPPSLSHEIEDVQSVRNVIYELQQTQQQLENVKSDSPLFKQQEQQLNSIKKPMPSTLPSLLIGEETISSASHSGSISETDEDSELDTFCNYLNSEEIIVAVTENSCDDKNARRNNINKVDSDSRILDKSDKINTARSEKNVETDSVMGSTYGVEVADALIDRNRRFEQGKIGYKSGGKSVCEQSVLGSQYGTEVMFNPPAVKRVVVASRKPRTLTGHNMGVKVAAGTANTTATAKQHVMKANLAMKQTADSSPRRTGAKSPTKLSNLPLKKLKLGAKKSART